MNTPQYVHPPTLSSANGTVHRVRLGGPLAGLPRNKTGCGGVGGGWVITGAEVRICALLYIGTHTASNGLHVQIHTTTDLGRQAVPPTLPVLLDPH